MTAEALHAHLATGATTVCRAWTVRRRDGTVMGFTDHDRDLVVEGVRCRADTGLSARALQQTTGLAVDNSEAIGALSDAAISETDLLAGRFDAAEVRSFLVNWAVPDARLELFRGSFGEVTRAAGSFAVELRGLSEALNRPQGYAYLPTCSAILGDARCRFDLARAGYQIEAPIGQVEDGHVFVLHGAAGPDERWFQGGRVDVLTGPAAGLVGVIRDDRRVASGRRIELWQTLGVYPAAGDVLRISAGCDKLAATCRRKFGNFLNFRGFPNVPGEDWLASYPVPDRPNPGGSRSA